MAGQKARAVRHSSKASRLAVLVALGAAVCYLAGPTFSVKGSWDGNLADVKDFPRGLGPQAVVGPAFGEGSGNVNIAIEDGRLVVNYVEGPLSVKSDDKKAWQANYTRDDTALRVSGQALDDLKWELSKQADVNGLGKIDLNVNSDQVVGVSLAPSLADFKGAQLTSSVRARGGEFQGRLEAQKQLADNMDLSYSVENSEGVYDLDLLKHEARLNARLGSNSDAEAKVVFNQLNLQPSVYNATFRRGDAVVGIDSNGAYGSLVGSRGVGGGLTAGYRALGRSTVDGADRSGEMAASLSHDLGKLTLMQSYGESPQARLESDVTMGSMRAQGRVDQTLDTQAMATMPSFNISLSRDMADLLGPGSSVQLGADGTTLDDLYGSVAASRDLGKSRVLEYSSAGRLKDMEHSLKVANDFGSARVVKRGDDAPRLQLGYQFEA